MDHNQYSCLGEALVRGWKAQNVNCIIIQFKVGGPCSFKVQHVCMRRHCSSHSDQNVLLSVHAEVALITPSQNRFSPDT